MLYEDLEQQSARAAVESFRRATEIEKKSKKSANLGFVDCRPIVCDQVLWISTVLAKFGKMENFSWSRSI